jgi:DNA-directed RNA polymerase sigma subunit (sigma70/sigma32)
MKKPRKFVPREVALPRCDAAATFEEIAEEMQIPPNLARYYYSSALKKLRRNPAAAQELLTLVEFRRQGGL